MFPRRCINIKSNPTIRLLLQWRRTMAEDPKRLKPSKNEKKEGLGRGWSQSCMVKVKPDTNVDHPEIGLFWAFWEGKERTNIVKEMIAPNTLHIAACARKKSLTRVDSSTRTSVRRPAASLIGRSIDKGRVSVMPGGWEDDRRGVLQCGPHLYVRSAGK